MVSTEAKELLGSLSESARQNFQEQRYILSYEEFLDVFSASPQKLMRNSAQYLRDMFQYFGTRESRQGSHDPKRHFKLFERPRGKNKPAIIGQEDAHESIYKVLEQFVRQGKVDKLILLHGPNGSSKSSTAENIAGALEEYSSTDEGAVYKFNWVFPCDKIGYEGLSHEYNKNIGFGDKTPARNGNTSFAHLEDEDIICKIVSEMKENPIFLLPKKARFTLFKKILAKNSNVEEIQAHFENGALGAKSKKIFDSLLVAYKGDLEKVLRHVQVERFFYSARYRSGIACVEPQMSIDAQDHQITAERNIQNIPPALQNIKLFEPHGELIDANRGFIEFSDLLKRPLEAFKYLLTTIEKMSINMASGVADLDLIMLASTNEKHLDAFKNSPDWPSFKGRFELVRVPYLLSASLEERIYEDDIKIIEKTKKIGPYSLSLVAQWAVLTRLRQPDPDCYDPNIRNLISRLDPYEKLAIYDGQEPSDAFSEIEKGLLRKSIDDIKKESQNSVAYEGRFGASPREIKMLLYFAAQNEKHDSLSAIAIFDEIEKLTRDRTIYDYLQFEPRGGYHDHREFIQYIKAQYVGLFNREFLSALNFYDTKQHVQSLQRYMRHVTAYLKKEKVLNEITGRHEEPGEIFMEEMEVLMGGGESKHEMREKIVSKVAAWRVENPQDTLNFAQVFGHELAVIARKIYKTKEDEIQKIQNAMMMFGSDDYKNLPKDLFDQCEETFNNLENNFGYTRKNTWSSLIFVGINNSKSQR